MIGDLMAVCCSETKTGMAMEHPRMAIPTGLHYVDKIGMVVGKTKEPTRIRTNNDYIFIALFLPCAYLPGVQMSLALASLWIMPRLLTVGMGLWLLCFGGSASPRRCEPVAKHCPSSCAFGFGFHLLRQISSSIFGSPVPGTAYKKNLK